jgi:hypothetical protein
MVLLIADPGPLRAAIEDDLRRAGNDVAVRTPSDDDLWLAARGRRAVVYLPAANLFEALVAPAPSVARLDEALAAAGAPGVEVLVPVFPDHPAFDVEVDALRRHGRPYAALRAPALLEEIASLVPSGGRALWLPRLGQARVATAAAVAGAVREAIDTEWQGRVTPIPSDRLDAAELVRRAAATSGRTLSVRALGPWLYRFARSLLRWLRRREAALLDALAPLIPELSAPDRRALPPARVSP